MNGLGMAAWLTVGVAIFCLGVLAAVVRRDRGGVLAGLTSMLGGTMLTLAVLLRQGVLPAAGLATLLLVLVLGGIFILVIEKTSAREDDS